MRIMQSQTSPERDIYFTSLESPEVFLNGLRKLCGALQTSRDMSENIFGIIRRAVSFRMECVECRLKFAANILNSRHKVYLGACVDKFISIIVTREYFTARAFAATFKRLQT